MKLKRAITAIVLLMTCVITMSRGALGAELDIKASIAVMEEYNDNIFLESENREEEYISRVIPALDITYRSPLWDWRVNYVYEYRYYANKTVDNESTHMVDAEMNMELINDFFFLHASDEYSRVSLDITRDFTRESLFINQTDRNVLDVNPYIRTRAGSHLRLTAGYIYSDVWYEDEAAIDAEDNVAYADVEYELSDRALLQTGYRHTSENSDADDFARNDVYAGTSYEYAEESRLFIRAGMTYIKFEGEETSSHGSWNAGLSHRFPYFTSTLQSSIDYDENPAGAPMKVASHSLSFDSTLEGVGQRIAFSYSEYVNSITDDVETKRYGLDGFLDYEINPRAACRLDVSADVYEVEFLDAYTTRYHVGLRLSYSLSRNFTVAVDERYAYVHSPDIAGDNYRNNRVTVELRKKL